MATLLEIPE